jgi:hypothetical protein
MAAGSLSIYRASVKTTAARNTVPPINCGPIDRRMFSYGPIANVFDPINNVLRIHYLAADQHLHELYLDATTS